MVINAHVRALSRLRLNSQTKRYFSGRKRGTPSHTVSKEYRNKFPVCSIMKGDLSSKTFRNLLGHFLWRTQPISRKRKISTVPALRVTSSHRLCRRTRPPKPVGFDRMKLARPSECLKGDKVKPVREQRSHGALSHKAPFIDSHSVNPHTTHSCFIDEKGTTLRLSSL